MFPEVKIKYEEKYDTELFGDLVVGEFYVKDTRARDMVVYVKTGYTSSLALHLTGGVLARYVLRTTRQCIL